MDISSLEQQAIDYARRGDFGADAKGINEELTRLAPENQGAWTRLARCNIELGLLDAANEALERVLQINPQNTIARSLLQESIRRQIRLLPEEPKRKRAASPRASRTSSTAAKKSARSTAALGRAQFAALGQLSPGSAVESVGPLLDTLLMSLNERPFAAKVVEARNRAGRPGNRLFRRNSIHAGPDGHLYAFHHGGRWEPQLNVGLFAAQQWGRSALRAGIGFDLRDEEAGAEREDGRDQALAFFEGFQQLVSTEWRGLLTDWMSTRGGFVQSGTNAPAADLLPADAVSWLVDAQRGAEDGWIFVGGWLFADRPDHAEILEDAQGLARWLEGVFNDLLPLWMSVYRRP